MDIPLKEGIVLHMNTHRFSLKINLFTNPQNSDSNIKNNKYYDKTRHY